MCFSEVVLERLEDGENDADDEGSRSTTRGRTGGENVSVRDECFRGTVDFVGILIDIGISNFGGDGIGCRCCVCNGDAEDSGEVVPCKDNALNFRDGELNGDNDDSPICCLFRGDIPFSAPSNVLPPKPTVVAVIVLVVRLVTNCSIAPTVIPPFPFAFPAALIFLGLCFLASTWSSNLATNLGIACRT